MSKIIRFKGPHGIPFWFQKLHKDVMPVSLRWTVFVGSADDERVGKPGLYHWFEHVPFRGTRKYPGGYQEIDLSVARHGGHIDASTTDVFSSFEAIASKHRWRQSFDVISDLVSAPLLRGKDIRAERDVIRQEIIGCHSEAGEYASDKIPGILYPGHPLGHPILGSVRDLEAMSATTLRRAYHEGYDRSRMAFFAAGDIPEKELIQAFEKAAEKAPNHGLSERRCGASYGHPPPWKAGEVSQEKTPFKSSIIYFLFSIPTGKDGIWPHLMAQEMLAAGELSSPLFAVLREEEGLVYDIDPVNSPYTEGGYWGFLAETSPRNTGYVIEAFWKAVRSRKARTRDRYNYVRDTVRGRRDTRLIDPDKIVEGVQDCTSYLKEPLGINQVADRYLEQSFEKVTEVLDNLSPNIGRTIVFKGSK